MRYVMILICLAWSVPAAAQPYAGCSPAEVRTIDAALAMAKELTLKAAAAVGDTSNYQRWFGDYSDARAEGVRATLKAVVMAIRSGGVTAECPLVQDGGCEAGEYAYVYPNEPYVVYLCPSFFNLPPLTALRPGTLRSDNGTREGTIVHEVSHFIRVADTDDHCYSRSDCRQMARNDPRRAIDNADSYQYFTEDLTYYARQPLAGKRPPAAPSDH